MQDWAKLILQIGCPSCYLTLWRKSTLIQKSSAQIPKAFYTLFFNKQSIFDPRPENCLSFLENRPKNFFNFYCLNNQTF